MPRFLVQRATYLWAAALLAAASLISFRSTYEPDLWWHLAQGREAAAGHLVRTNLFSAVYPDYPQPYTSWLFDLGSYLLWTRGGPAALQAVQALLIAATLGAIDWAVLSVPRVNELSGVGQFREPDWGTAYSDAAVQIVVRRSGPYGRLAF